jgi:hypothetical protein
MLFNYCSGDECYCEWRRYVECFCNVTAAVSVIVLNFAALSIVELFRMYLLLLSGVA